MLRFRTKFDPNIVFDVNIGTDYSVRNEARKFRRLREQLREGNKLAAFVLEEVVDSDVFRLDELQELLRNFYNLELYLVAF